MCGIAGIMSLGGPPPRRGELSSMTSALVHRGPDSSGIFLSHEVGLAMRRLSIIDLETGSQPVRNEDGSIWTVFNGEIYNYRDLRRELESAGHVFASATDTETIVHLYERDGIEFVQALRGMFAIALWDRNRRTLVLARDRIGIKPLYYAEIGGRLIFASEVKALLQLEGVDRSIRWSSMAHLLASRCTPPGESILEGIRKLEPGHVLEASAENGVRVSRYWEFTMRPDVTSSEGLMEEKLRALLDESVKLHLVSDVPVGAFLSGGIDSSAVVALMARSAGSRVKTFSIGFEEEPYDETAYAGLAARTLGTEHHETVVGSQAVEILQDLAWYLDEPFGDPSAIPTFIVSRLAAQHVKVALSGDGGDELFAGYDKYVVERSQRRWRLLPRSLKKIAAGVAGSLPEGVRGRNYLRHISLDDPYRYLDSITLFSAEERRRLVHPDLRISMGMDPWSDENARLLSGGHWLGRLQALDVRRYLPLDILTKVDRMSMAHSLEARVPLLDHKLVEFAATIPPWMNLRGSITKHLFKRAMAGIVPAEILTRRKQGFAVPIGDWFRGSLRDFVRDLLLGETARRRGILDTIRVEQLLWAHDRGRPLDSHLWLLVSFELWCRTFLDQNPAKFPMRSPLRQRRRASGTDGLELLGSAA